MSQFKAGDLALVWKCDEAPEMVGKCVELVQYLPAGSELDEWETIPVDSWLVRGDGLIAATVGIGMIPVDETIFAEKLLMPLRGDFTPETER